MYYTNNWLVNDYLAISICDLVSFWTYTSFTLSIFLDQIGLLDRDLQCIRTLRLCFGWAALCTGVFIWFEISTDLPLLINLHAGNFPYCSRSLIGICNWRLYSGTKAGGWEVFFNMLNFVIFNTISHTRLFCWRFYL